MREVIATTLILGIMLGVFGAVLFQWWMPA